MTGVLLHSHNLQAIQCSARAQKTHLTPCLLCLYLFPSLWHGLKCSPCVCVCVCVYEGVWEIVRESTSRFPPQGAMTSQTPLRSLVMLLFFAQPALACAPCCTPNIADGRESPEWFLKTTREHKSFPFYHFFMRWGKHVFAGYLWSQDMSKNKKRFICWSDILEDEEEIHNKTTRWGHVVKNRAKCLWSIC